MQNERIALWEKAGLQYNTVDIKSMLTKVHLTTLVLATLPISQRKSARQSSRWAPIRGSIKEADNPHNCVPPTPNPEDRARDTEANEIPPCVWSDRN
jgi:hypothetical protein